MTLLAPRRVTAAPLDSQTQHRYLHNFLQLSAAHYHNGEADLYPRGGAQHLCGFSRYA